MARITVNTTEAVALGVQAKAKQHDRSESAYVELLIKADLRAAGLLPDSPEAGHTELLAKITAALSERPEIADELQQVVRKATRRSRRTLTTASAK